MRARVCCVSTAQQRRRLLPFPRRAELSRNDNTAKECEGTPLAGEAEAGPLWATHCAPSPLPVGPSTRGASRRSELAWRQMQQLVRVAQTGALCLPPGHEGASSACTPPSPARLEQAERRSLPSARPPACLPLLNGQARRRRRSLRWPQLAHDLRALAPGRPQMHDRRHLPPSQILSYSQPNCLWGRTKPS